MIDMCKLSDEKVL